MISIPLVAIPTILSLIGCLITFIGMLSAGGGGRAIPWAQGFCLCGALAIVSAAFLMGVGVHQ